MRRARDFDELFRHDAFVRTLARRLAADAASADDVAQEAWLAAWRTPPDDRGPLRHWLACAVRGAASNLRRAFARRTRHERAAARAEAAAPERIAEREESRRLLHAAVSALDEPYRTVVLLRYFEGRTPTEIARETGAPVETVRTRLKRAQAALRERLRAGGEGTDAWRTVLLPLTGWSPGAFAAAAGTAAGGTTTGGAAWIGGATMGAKAKTAAAAFVAATALLTVGAYEVGAAEATRGAAAARGSTLSDGASATDEDGLAAERRDARTRGTDATTSRGAASSFDGRAAPAFDAALGVVLHGRVTDEAGAPIPGAHLGLRDAEWNSAGAATDADGRYALPGLACGTWTATIGVAGFATYQRTVEIAEATDVRHDVRLVRSAQIVVAARRADGTPLTPAGRDVRLRRWWCAYVLREVPDRLPAGNSAYLPDFGLGRFRQQNDGRRQAANVDELGVLDVDVPPPYFVVLAHGAAVVASRYVAVPTERVEFSIDEDAYARSTGAVRVRLVDAATGMPVAGASLRCADSSGWGAPPGPTDADGVRRFDGLRPGIMALETHEDVPGRARLRLSVEIAPGATTDLGDVRWSEAVVVEGSGASAGAASDPLRPEGGATLSATPLAELERDGVVNDRRSYGFEPTGTFRIDDLARGRSLLQLSRSDPVTGVRAIVPRIVDTSAGPVSGLELRFPPMGRIAFDLAASEAHGVVRIDDATGAPVHAFRANQAATYRLDLPLGVYRVRTSGPGARDRTFTAR